MLPKVATPRRSAQQQGPCRHSSQQAYFAIAIGPAPGISSKTSRHVVLLARNMLQRATMLWLLTFLDLQQPASSPCKAAISPTLALSLPKGHMSYGPISRPLTIPAASMGLVGPFANPYSLPTFLQHLIKLLVSLLANEIRPGLPEGCLS